MFLSAGDPFHADNRMGLTGTLHRISAIRDRDGSVIGLTYRIGRHVSGTPISHIKNPSLTKTHTRIAKSTVTNFCVAYKHITSVLSIDGAQHGYGSDIGNIGADNRTNPFAQPAQLAKFLLHCNFCCNAIFFAQYFT